MSLALWLAVGGRVDASSAHLKILAKELTMLHTRLPFAAAVFAVLILFAGGAVTAAEEKPGGNACKGLPDFKALKAALEAATSTETSGLNNHMWATIVDRDGVVCVVAFSGVDRGAQWPGSRVISAQKANTANSFSLDGSSTSNGSGTGAAP